MKDALCLTLFAIGALCFMVFLTTYTAHRLSYRLPITPSGGDWEDQRDSINRTNEECTPIQLRTVIRVNGRQAGGSGRSTWLAAVAS